MGDQKTATLGTGLTFDVHDMQGQLGFPRGAGGICYQHNTGEDIYLVRTEPDESGWRVDLLYLEEPTETVFGLGLDDGVSLWSTKEKAAAALAAVLNAKEAK